MTKIMSLQYQIIIRIQFEIFAWICPWFAVIFYNIPQQVPVIHCSNCSRVITWNENTAFCGFYWPKG